MIYNQLPISHINIYNYIYIYIIEEQKTISNQLGPTDQLKIHSTCAQISSVRFLEFCRPFFGFNLKESRSKKHRLTSPHPKTSVKTCGNGNLRHPMAIYSTVIQPWVNKLMYFSHQNVAGTHLAATTSPISTHLHLLLSSSPFS